MSGKLTRDAYEQLIAEDIAWLRTIPRTLEREHIIQVLEASPMHEYGERAPDSEPPKSEACPSCHGGLRLRGSGFFLCSDCKGTGKRPAPPSGEAK